MLSPYIFCMGAISLNFDAQYFRHKQRVSGSVKSSQDRLDFDVMPNLFFYSGPPLTLLRREGGENILKLISI